MDPPVLETERLTLRPLREGDAESLHAAFGDEETLRFWHRLPRGSAEETREMLMASARRAGSCEWSLCERGSQLAVGQLGFGPPDAGGRASFGYILRKEHWGKGYAAEAARAAMAHGLGPFGLCSAELWIYEGNRRSVRVAEKLGATLRGRFVAFNLERRFARPTYVYGITAREWGVADAPEPPVAVFGVQPVLEVVDVQTALDFWCGRLGFRLDWAIGDPPTSAAVARSDWGPGAVVRFARAARAPAERTGWMAFPVEDAGRLHDEFLAREVAIDSAPERKPWGLTEFDVVDPNQQRLRFFSP